MRNNKKLYRRKFINKNVGAAVIVVDFDKWGGRVHITDCSRSINLEFNTYSDYDDDMTPASKAARRKDLKDSIAKADVLVSEFTVVKEYLESMLEQLSSTKKSKDE